MGIVRRIRKVRGAICKDHIIVITSPFYCLFTELAGPALVTPFKITKAKIILGLQAFSFLFWRWIMNQIKIGFFAHAWLRPMKHLRVKQGQHVVS